MECFRSTATRHAERGRCRGVESEVRHEARPGLSKAQDKNHLSRLPRLSVMRRQLSVHEHSSEKDLTAKPEEMTLLGALARIGDDQHWLIV